MKRNITIPFGYKASPIGLIPADWEIQRLGDICDIDKDSLSSNTPPDYEFDYISLSDVDSESVEITTSKQIFKTAPSRARRIVKKNDIIISTVRPNLKAFFHIKNEVKDLIVSTGFAVLTPNINVCGAFLIQYFFSDKISKQFYQLVVGSNYPAINSSDVSNLKILLPPLKEQERIVSVLQLWDTAIEMQTALIEKLKLRKRGLMQKLLTGKKRLPGFTEEWKEVRLGNVGKFMGGCAFAEEEQGGQLGIPFYKVSDMNLLGNESKMTNANNYVTQEQIIRLGYVVIEEDAIIFAKVGAAIALERKRYAKNFIIDNNMLAFIPKENIWFMKYWFDSIYLSKYIQVGALPSYNASDLSIIKLKIPSSQEQISIASILIANDKEIELANNKLARLQKEKRGLMQVLLTGKKRIRYEI